MAIRYGRNTYFGASLVTLHFEIFIFLSFRLHFR